MTTRKRIRNPGGDITGTGGGISVGGGTVEWGPRFGDPRDEAFLAQAATQLWKVDPSGANELDAQQESNFLPSLAGANASQQAVSVDAVDLSGAAASQAAGSGHVKSTWLEPTEDFYVDENQATSSFQSATTILARTGTDLLNTRRRAYFAWDLTNYGPMGSVITGYSNTIEFSCLHDNLFTQSLSYQLMRASTKPWDASPTWDESGGDGEYPGTIVASGSIVVPASSSFSRRGIVLSNVQAAALDGQYVWLYLSGSTGVGNEAVAWDFAAVGHATESPAELILTHNFWPV